MCECARVGVGWVEGREGGMRLVFYVGAWTCSFKVVEKKI